MARIIAVNAVHAGCGVSTIAANLAAVAATGWPGARVGVIDACLSAPTVHLLFGLPQHAFQRTLNDFLLGRCRLEEAIHPLSISAGEGHPASVLIVPANPDPAAVVQAERGGLDVENLGASCQQLADDLGLDWLFVDTEPGLPASTLASLSAATDVLLVLALDKQHYQAMARTVAVVDKMSVSERRMLVNLVSPSLRFDSVSTEVAQSYGWQVMPILPYCAELSALASASLFVQRYPTHPVAAVFRQIMAGLAE